jgi:hypothetical protein
MSSKAMSSPDCCPALTGSAASLAGVAGPRSPPLQYPCFCTRTTPYLSSRQHHTTSISILSKVYLPCPLLFGVEKALVFFASLAHFFCHRKPIVILLVSRVGYPPKRPLSTPSFLSQLVAIPPKLFHIPTRSCKNQTVYSINLMQISATQNLCFTHHRWFPQMYRKFLMD